MDKDSSSRTESESFHPQEQKDQDTHHTLLQASQDYKFNDFIDLFQQYRIHATLDNDYTYTDTQICKLYSAWLEHPHFHNKYRDVIDQTLASKYLREAAEKGTFKLNPVLLFTNRQGAYGTTGPVWKLILERKIYYPFDAQTLSYRVRQLRYNVVTPEGIRPAALDDMCRDGHIKEQEEWFAKIVLERLERRSKDPSIHCN